MILTSPVFYDFATKKGIRKLLPRGGVLAGIDHTPGIYGILKESYKVTRTRIGAERRHYG